MVISIFYINLLTDQSVNKVQVNGPSNKSRLVRVLESFGFCENYHKDSKTHFQLRVRYLTASI